VVDEPAVRGVKGVGVLRAAVEELLERDDRSYTELSVGDICAAAGISRPTFYAYVNDKIDLARAMAAETIGELVGVSSVWLSLPPRSSSDELEQAMSAMFTAYAPHRHVMAAAAEVASYDPDFRTRFAAVVEEAAARVARHIADGQRDGYVRAELDPTSTARWLGWMTERGLRRAHAEGSSTPRAAVKAMTDIHWFTLYAGVR
jgi:AcrR family transcriptional regulator